LSTKLSIKTKTKQEK